MILTKCKIKEINLDEIITSKTNSSALNELLLIVPTNRKVRYLKRELISSSPSKVVSGINIETLGRATSVDALNILLRWVYPSSGYSDLFGVPTPLEIYSFFNNLALDLIEIETDKNTQQINNLQDSSYFLSGKK